MLVLLTLLAGTINAQKIEGKVIDEDGRPLEDAGIFNKTSGQHSHTNSAGYFVLDRTSANDSIYISRLGYATKIFEVDKNAMTAPFLIRLKQSSISLDQVVVVQEIEALSRIVDVDIKTTPVKSSQEILRKVPGLIIGQHAGGGKAEQIFLRGFDVDHGTDVALNVDGLPVNMVSHAHGQGYADLHFVIPETIAGVNFGKGPYYANQGNFNTAGYVGLELRKELDQSMVSLEAGQFDTQRLVGLFKLFDKSNSNAYIASELYLTDGPVESPQNFNRINIMGRYRYRLPGSSELVLTASHFQSKWDASGQIPQRAVDQGIISRFGAIDDTEGGKTSRTNLLVNHTTALDAQKILKTRAYVSNYGFELFSNFTFFLEDPENGDQIRQFEERTLLGAETVFENKSVSLGNTNFEYQAGIGFRYDDVNNNELANTLNRKTTLNRNAFGDVDEVNTYGFLSAELNSGQFMFNPSLRLDYFKFDYVDQLQETYSTQSEQKAIVSPKFNVVYSPNMNTQFFLKTGIGFHSNDTRVVVANEGEDILPAAYGLDLGTIIKPVDKLAVNATLWALWLDQEFVYVGDAGIVEPSGKTQRLGVELGLRYQAADWLYLYADANYTHARSTQEPRGIDYIPLAPDFTTVGGFSIMDHNGFSGGLNYRYLDDRPANEDNSIVAEGYFVTDANLNYTTGNFTFGLIVENLFDVAWKETQFATESRLINESQPVEEIHFTPGTPFFVRGKVAVRF